MSAPEYDAIDPDPASNRPPSRDYHHLLMEAEKKIAEQKVRIDELETLVKLAIPPRVLPYIDDPRTRRDPPAKLKQEAAALADRFGWLLEP